MAAETVKGAVIGCGFFAQNHLRAWGDVTGAALTAVCDTDPQKAQAAADLTGATPYTDAADMLDREALDFIDVATTMETHRTLVELAAARGVSAICQKPFGPTLDDVRAMIAAADAAGTVLMVHENFRFQTPLIAVRRLLDEGAIGKPFFAAIDFRTGFDVYANQPYLAEVERFIILDLGIHVLDVARFLLGDARSVYCRAASIRPGIRGEDQAAMLLDHQDGAVSAVSCTYAASVDPDPFPQTLIALDGDRGSIRLGIDFRLELHTKDGVEVRDVSPRTPSWGEAPWDLVQESVINTQQHWVDCLLSGTAPATSGHDNFKTFALVEAAYESAASGQPATPQDPHS
ncbi:MAG: Gfo/Idh/MocA family protein [Inquilinaceae bacterium]